MTQPDLTIPKYPRPDVRRPELRDHDLVSDSELPALDPEALDLAILESPHDIDAHEAARFELRTALFRWWVVNENIRFVETTGCFDMWDWSNLRKQCEAEQQAILHSIPAESTELLDGRSVVVVEDVVFLVRVDAISGVIQVEASHRALVL